MPRQIWIVIAIAATTITGCSSTPQDNTTTVCAEYYAMTEQFLKESPEGRALTDAAERQYKGTIDKADYQAAVTTFNKAFGARLKPLANEATKPELRNALTGLSDSYSSGESDVAGISNIAKICPDPSSSPSRK